MKIIILIIVLCVSAMAQIKPNQAIVEANVEISATLFNRQLIIDVLKVSEGRTSIVIHSDKDTRIDGEKAGYEITVDRYRIKIQEVKTDSVVFFVERSESTPQAYLIDKSRAYQIYRGDELKEGDLQLFVEGANTARKIAIVLKAKDLESFKDGFEMTGLVPGRRVVPETCFGSKGQDCIVHGKIFR